MDKLQTIVNALKDMSDSDIVALWNERCEECNCWDDRIYYMQEFNDIECDFGRRDDESRRPKSHSMSLSVISGVVTTSHLLTLLTGFSLSSVSLIAVTTTLLQLFMVTSPSIHLTLKLARWCGRSWPRLSWTVTWTSLTMTS